MPLCLVWRQRTGMCLYPRSVGSGHPGSRGSLTHSVLGVTESAVAAAAALPRRDGVGLQPRTQVTRYDSYRGRFKQRCYSPERAGTFKGGARTDVFVKEDRSRWPPPRRGSPHKTRESLVLACRCGAGLPRCESRGYLGTVCCMTVDF